MAKKVFVSWSSERGHRIAKALSDTILFVAGLESWVSKYDLRAGRPWFDEIERAAKECDAAIGCLTPGAAQRPWVNFEAGMLFGRLKNFVPLRFNEEPKGPLEHLQSIDGMTRDGVTTLLTNLIGDPQKAEQLVKFVYEDWKGRVDEVFATHSGEHEIRSSAEMLRDTILTLSRNPQLSGNECLRLIVNLSLKQMQKNVATFTDTYRSPQMDYPHHLVHLQKEYGAHVRAIALLQELEHFWQTMLGNRIRDTSVHDSSRVFVVRNERQLEEHWQTLQNHAIPYRVYVLHYDVLTTTIDPRFVRDFSIITVDGASVLASYDAHGGYIEYTSNQAIIDEAARIYNEITLRSQRLLPRETNLETFKTEVFSNRGLTVLKKKPVEMSEYVEVDDYDSHEQEHAYYVEMMNRMVASFRERFPDDKGPYRVLELGAGTGIFTRHLAQIPSITEIVALEIDWAYHARLKYNLRHVPHVKPLNEDSRGYDFSPSGHFEAIFSSFADHHIKPQDKRGYLRNVHNKLKAGGLFIVGDELLRPHDTTDEQQWLDALAAYHGHIIEIAQRKGQDVLVKLETAAWESGKDKRGDFKLQCAEYETHLRDSGFTFRKERIGPESDQVAAQVGGVYVYVAEPLGSDVTNQRW